MQLTCIPLRSMNATDPNRSIKNTEMKRQILLIQHCEAEHHLNGMVGSWTDTDLTDYGRRQASRVAGRVSEIISEAGNWKLVSSDLKRCAQTAEIVAKMIGLQPIYERGLREHFLGKAVGKTLEWAEQNENEKPSIPPGVDWRPFDDAETWREFYQRISTCMKGLLNQNSENLAIVVHGGTSVSVVAWWLRLPVEQLIDNDFGMKAAAISVLGTNEWNQHVLRSLCDTAHLAGLTRD